MAQFKLKVCKSCGAEFKQYNSFTKCKCKVSAPKLQQKKKYSIPKVSEKRKIENLKYSVLRTEFLGKKENQICPITKQQTIEVHHTYCGKDRAKYYLDVSTWLAVSRDGHNWIHDNPKEARKLGFLK
jgi:hypothetical protein